ncbi:MAG: DUF6438 domain-containing protein [Bacteroidales bacterium]|nr:DUF6438 domain-containing protein [Bacteroidales bacterium]
MKKMKQIITIGILIIFIWSCKHTDKNADRELIKPIDTLQTLIGTNWNIIINETDSNLFKYNNQPLYFKRNYACFFDQKIAELSVSGDTIFIRDTSYIVLSQPDSFKLSVKTYLIGKIEKISKDSLIIKKIKGWGRPFYYNEKYKFYNDTLIYNPNLKLNRIVYSTSTCYGKCPAMAIEILSNGNYKFYGGSYSEFKGNFIGTIGANYIKKIEGELRVANIEEQPDYFPEPIDAPICEMIIYYNDSLRKEITGYFGDFPPRVKNIALLMYNSYKSAKMDSVGEKINFETKVHNPAPPPLPPPIPNEL